MSEFRRIRTKAGPVEVVTRKVKAKPSMNEDQKPDGTMAEVFKAVSIKPRSYATLDE